MSLSSGTRVGGYEIVAKLGEGGMGEVYRGRDSRLNRDVAIKVLPDAFAADPDRLARFTREAQALAALSHPNIAQVYGLEDLPSDGGRSTNALVMELVAGDDLSVHIARGPLPLDDALPIARQIAEALEAAHGAGIVHRDLKPANVKIKPDGAVKVLDFGLAKAMDSAVTSGVDPMLSPTLTVHATQLGMILGTAAYMAPEQARGKAVDKRADIWAFGVVLYEMLTGRRPFTGEETSDVLAAVLRQDIDWTALPAGTPADISRLLRRCLERDPRNRLHDIADARIVLDEVARGGAVERVAEAPAAAPRSARRWALVAIATAAVLGLGFAAGRWTAPAPTRTDADTIRLVIPTPPGVTEMSEPAVPPDGSFVVFVGANSKSRQLYVQQLSQTAPRPVERTDGARVPVVSPDGRWIAFQRSNRLEKIALDGGDPIPLTDLSRTSGPGAAWLPDGRIIVASWLSNMFAVPADGGTPRPISTLDTTRGEIGHWFPDPLPGGRHLLMTVWTKATGINDAEIAVLDLETGKHTVLFKGAEGRYLARGFLVYFRAGAYHAIRFNPDTRVASGDAVRVLDDAAGNAPEGDISHADLSAGGTFADLSGPYIWRRELALISAGGAIETLPFPVRPYVSGDLSADGKRLAIPALDAGRYVIRLMDLDRRTENYLDLPASSWNPVWHPDGRRLAFETMRKGDFDVYALDVTAATPSAPLLETEFDDSPMAFQPDGSLIVQQSDRSGRYLLKKVPLSPPGPTVTLVPFSADNATLSRDGRFMAFEADRQGTSEIYVQAAAGGEAPEKISSAGGTTAAWSSNGRELLYLRAPEIVAVPFTVENGRFRPGAERIWSRAEGNYLDQFLEVGADGRALVAIDRKGINREIRVIINWQPEIASKFK